MPEWQLLVWTCVLVQSPKAMVAKGHDSAANGWAKGLYKEAYIVHYSTRCIWFYDSIHASLALVKLLRQPLNNHFGTLFQVGMGFLVLEAKHQQDHASHPLMKHEFKPIFFLGEKSAKGESARIPPWPKRFYFVLQGCNFKNPSKSFQLVLPLSGNL